jgi:hypothetical protein
MKELHAIASRLRDVSTLAELLDAGFDTFEAIRLIARVCEGRAPGLFAAFMTAAGTAVDGRNALNDAPSLPPPTRPPSVITVSATAGAGLIADELAMLAALLAQRLAETGAWVFLEDDRAACQHATRAARHIHRLLARDLDETVAR